MADEVDLWYSTGADVKIIAEYASELKKQINREQNEQIYEKKPMTDYLESEKKLLMEHGTLSTKEVAEKYAENGIVLHISLDEHKKIEDERLAMNDKAKFLNGYYTTSFSEGFALMNNYYLETNDFSVFATMPDLNSILINDSATCKLNYILILLQMMHACKLNDAKKCNYPALYPFSGTTTIIPGDYDLKNENVIEQWTYDPLKTIMPIENVSTDSNLLIKRV